MALWAKVQLLTRELTGDAMRQIHAVYGVHFPIDVRYYFAEWIESQPWDEIEEDNPQHELWAGQLLEAILKMLEEKANELSSEDKFLPKLRLQETGQQFREMYGNNPMNLVRVVKNCLATETRLVAQAENTCGGGGQQDMHRQILQKFEDIQNKTQDTERDLRTLQQKQESFIIQYQDSLKINSQLQQLTNQPNGQTRLEKEQCLQRQKQQVEVQLSEKARELLSLRLELAEKHEQTVNTLRALQTHILDEQLIRWKRQQQLAGNGASFEDSLETLQQWCENLAELIWQNRQQIKKVDMLRTQLPIDIPQGQQDLLPMLNTAITGLLSSLVTSTFIIEKQPPQVLKKDSRFTATVRLLVGSKLNVHMNPPTVRATIISEEQARGLLRNNKNIKDSSGNILNNTGTMECNQANGQLAVTFRNMQLKSIKRAEKKGNETVTEEKFSILFQSEFTVGGGQLVFQVWTLSLPVVVTVHGNQECNALATILWDNAFAEPGRAPFQVPEKVPWPLLAESLNCKFNANTGMGLSPENLNYLASKLFGPADDYSQQMVSWVHFNRDPLPVRNFTFWEWFYAILKLTKDNLQGLWRDGLIYGFISKQEASDRLMQRPTGTFLCRFSDSEVGGITIAWIAEDPNNPTGERMVWNLAPFTSKDFNIRGLANRIKDLPNLVWLLPDLPKAQVFSKYWSQPTEQLSRRDGGYIGTDIVAVIPGILSHPAAPLSYDNPQTPLAHVQPPSPQSMYDTTSQPPQGFDDMTCDSSQIDAAMDENMDFVFNATDYNPEDIDQINVNELINLHTQPKPPN